MPQPLVLDTNIVLDLFVFDDPKAQALMRVLRDGTVRWLATAPMREELARVLAYPHIAARVAARGTDADAVLGGFEQHAELVDEAARAPYACKDPDDQKFIDLAAAHQAVLLSKDAQVLCMRSRLARVGVAARAAWELPAQAQPRAM
ncbi:MAG: putative toxin-antitoxin system toxin component, PIN family [Pseudomonadota bacterium]